MSDWKCVSTYRVGDVISDDCEKDLEQELINLLADIAMMDYASARLDLEVRSISNSQDVLTFFYNQHFGIEVEQ
jgi:hypothetical protein